MLSIIGVLTDLRSPRRSARGYTVTSPSGVRGPGSLLPAARVSFAMRYRHFRNADPPALVQLWNEALTRRGAVELRSHTPLDNAVFNKPYFDPAGFLVAEDDGGRVAGFAHGGFGPNEDL